MGEIIFSIFVGGYLAAVGLFLNWYLGREMKKVGTESGKTKSEGGAVK